MRDAHTRLAAKIKAKFQREGKAISSWADENGFERTLVYHVLNGYRPCVRGESHRCAVALGLKPDPNAALPRSQK
jgi:gp16 family phage-associated protein